MTTIYYAELDAAGRVVSVMGITGDSATEARAHVLLPDWTGWPVPPAPHQVLAYRNGALVWEDPRTLAQMKAHKWAEIKAARAAAEDGGFTWDGSIFDSDMASNLRISGAVQLAQIVGGAFSIDWTLADNSVRTLSAAQMVAVGVAAGQHVATQRAIGRGLRTQINSATTPQDLEVIVWP